MKQLLIVAHGSRRESSNDEIRKLAVKVAANLQLVVDDVTIAFLEFASPSIEAALDDCFGRGTAEVAVLPYFLSGGNHVVDDIPREITTALNKWPDKEVTMLPHIGASDAMASLVAQAF